MKTVKVNTWLPGFSGFYGTYWDGDGHDEEQELENINETRKEKGLEPVEYDALDFDYVAHRKNQAEMICRRVTADLVKEGLVSSCEMEKLYSPREYNFANDAIYVAFALSKANRKKILDYLKTWRDEFAVYLKERYTSGPRFYSSYPSDVESFMEGQAALEDKHKLGAILNFILLNEDREYELSVYEYVTGNGGTLYASNYAELVG